MSNPLIFFGNNCIQNENINLSVSNIRTLSGMNVQQANIPRADGSVVINTKLEAKEITLSGNITGKTEAKFENVKTRLNQILGDKRQHYLRIVPGAGVLANVLSIADWSVDGNAFGLKVNEEYGQISGAGIEIQGTGVSDLKNGSFEEFTGTAGTDTVTDPIANWTAINTVNTYTNIRNDNVTDGVVNAMIASSTGAGIASLSQVVPLAGGKNYTITFDARTFNGNVSGHLILMTDEVTPRYYNGATWSTTPSNALNVSGNGVMAAHTLSFTAPSSSVNVTVRFEKVSNALEYIALDNVKLFCSNPSTTIKYNAQTPADVTNMINNLFNIEFFMYLQGVYFVDSITLKFGNDSSNYYSVNFNKNLEGDSLVNGWNLFSAPLTSELTSVGTVAKSAIDYFEFVINYKTGTNFGIDRIVIGDLFLVDESLVRNFKCFRSGEVPMTYDHYEISRANIDLTFLNFTGYAESTHFEKVSKLANITSFNKDVKTFLDGSIVSVPIHKIKLNSGASLTGVTLQNKTTNQSIDLSAALAVGDLVNVGGNDMQFNKNGTQLDFNGVIPGSVLGDNIYNLAFGSSSGETVISQANDSVQGITERMGITAIAQSFTAVNSYYLTQLQMSLAVESDRQINGASYTIQICSDSAGDPGTVLSSSTLFVPKYSGIMSGLWLKNLLQKLTNGQKYWIQILNPYVAFYNWDGGGYKRLHFGHAPNDASYAGGTAKYFENGVWHDCSYDLMFQAIVTNIPSVNYDWEINYKKLYLN